MDIKKEKDFFRLCDCNGFSNDEYRKTRIQEMIKNNEVDVNFELPRQNFNALEYFFFTYNANNDETRREMQEEISINDINFVLDVFLDNNIDPNHELLSGKDALFFAVLGLYWNTDYWSVLKKMIDYGYNPYRETEDGVNTISILESKGEKELKSKLEEWYGNTNR